MSKYQRWYDGIVLAARNRVMPKCYTEVHHIKPKSLGGGNEEANLVRLTYREHFLAHWLLTKICVAGDLRRMQRAMWAMTLASSGKRITTGWQFEAAKRAIRDLELDPVIEAAWKARYEEYKVAKYEAEKAKIVALYVKKVRAPSVAPTAEDAKGKRPSEISKLAGAFISAHNVKRKFWKKDEKRVVYFDHPTRAGRMAQIEAAVAAVLQQHPE